jgi:hypothetical protein
LGHFGENLSGSTDGYEYPATLEPTLRAVMNVRSIVQKCPTRGSRPHFVNCAIKYRTIIQSLGCATYCECTRAARVSAQSNGCGPKQHAEHPWSCVRCVRDVIVPVLIFGHTNCKRSLMDISDINVACVHILGQKEEAGV